MSTPEELASALYGATTPSQPKPSALTSPAPAPTVLTPMQDAASAPTRPAPQNQLQDRPLDAAARLQEPVQDAEAQASLLFDGGRVGSSPDEYSGAVLASAWDAHEFNARSNQNTEEIADLSEGRREVAGFMHEIGVPVPVAKEVTAAAQEYVGKSALDDLALDAANAKCTETLRGIWKGDEFSRQVGYAQVAYRAALQRPGVGWWLSQMDAAGMGSDPKVVQAFAKIGAKMARSGGHGGRR